MLFKNGNFEVRNEAPYLCFKKQKVYYLVTKNVDCTISFLLGSHE
jgi:hypothetical protein